MGERFASRVVALCKYRIQLQDYLREKMHDVAPNLAVLIGEVVGARLISHAGSLTSLAKYPASTVQILGAEKALFRALKTKGNTPKYGLIFHSTFIGRAGAKNKGRISRYLANKCSIASRIDCFSDNPSSVFGDHLKQQVEDRLKFYEEGAAPTKNVDVMKQACVEYALEQEKLLNEAKKQKKEEKKVAKEAKESTPQEGAAESVETAPAPEKKKKKKKDAELPAADTTMETTMETTMDISVAVAESTLETSQDASAVGETEKKKKKKKKAKEASAEPAVEVNGEVTPAAPVAPVAPIAAPAVPAVPTPAAEEAQKEEEKEEKGYI